MKSVICVLLDNFADWEAAFLAPALRGGLMPEDTGKYRVLFASPEARTVHSLGGLTVQPDCGIDALPEDCAGVILVGGLDWQTPKAETVAPMVREAFAREIIVGAICNATGFLAAHGWLNDVHHTGNTVEMLKAWGGANYTGERLYEERQAVRDGNVVTANGTGYLEFTRECLAALDADTPEAIARFYDFNKHGFYGE
ncbi:MAG: glutamine amidotransferase [Alistipes senegalensis]|nr:glutamine amidotransferase [Bacteroides cellulosilyticus]MCM1351472.1 glutamine amidotransferase [Alistipes senegalensis]